MNAQLQAWSLAGLLCLPVVLLNIPRRPLNVPASRRSRAAAAVAFTVLTVAVTGWLVAHVNRDALGQTEAAMTILVLTCGMVGAALTQVFPLSGPLAYALLAYTFPRDNTVTLALRDLGVMSSIAVLSVVGAAVWAYGNSENARVTSRVPLQIAAAFFAWMSVSIAAAIVSGRPVEPDLLIRSERYAQAAAIFFVCAVSRPSLRAVRMIVLVVATAVIVRQVLLTSSWFREQNLAMLAVITAPLAIAAACGRPFGILQAPLALAGVYLSVMVVRIQNRGAIVGLLAGAVVAWLVARVRWQWSVAFGVIVAAAGAGAFAAGVLDRFGEIYGNGQFLDSAASRLKIWVAGAQLASDHWLFGVGPGNFAVMASDQTAGTVTEFAHNVFVEVLTEVGIVALVLYAGLFAMTFQAIWAATRVPLPSGARLTLSGFAGALTAHVAAGCFFANASLVFTWMWIGTALAFMGGAPEAQPHLPGRNPKETRPGLP